MFAKRSFVQRTTQFVATLAAITTVGAVAHAQATLETPPSAPSSSTQTAPLPPSSAQPQSQGGPMAVYPFTIQRTHSYWQTHGFDFAASASGRYQQIVTSQQPARTNPTEGLGVLVNIREHPVPWFGLELNYGFNHYSERFTSASTGFAIGRLQQDQHEATAGYLLHIRAPGIQPFIALGGGGINFRGTHANPQYGNQWRGTYMYEVGFDFVSRNHPHFGVRVQEHGLFYKAPDYHIAGLRSNGYIHQAMPSAGLFYRF